MPGPAGGTPDGLTAGSGGAAGAFSGVLGLLVFAFLVVPGLARLRSEMVVPSTSAIPRPHEVPG